MTTPDDITITPGLWCSVYGGDPAARIMTLTVTGAAPGLWQISDGGAYGFYFHVRHNGHHINMTHWNAWEEVKACIARESGPYTVTYPDAPITPQTDLTLSDARLAVVRAEKHDLVAIITNPDGNEVRFPRRPEPED